MGADFTMITELDLPEFAVGQFSNSVSDLGSEVFFGAPMTMAVRKNEADAERKGRRVAAICKSAVNPSVGLTSPDKHVDELWHSGRWTEVRCPISESGHYLTMAVLYGVSGATQPCEARTRTEDLLIMATARSLSFGDVLHW